ncbi:hypothetical protein ACIBCO_35785 [Streptomyces violascens]|uniref:hypothetical protein n=1 Tax=Streptomyces violascens TaxID=67381 RepID=UPI0037993550
MTTQKSRNEQPAAELDRDRAWAHLLENPGGVRRQQHGDVRRLLEIARTYDRICQRAEGYLQPDVSETDILAVLRVIRTLHDKLDDDERMLLSLARSKTITWARIATALELSGRQSAERRYLQLSKAYRRPDGTLPRTQSERVEQAREQRSRRAEREWARCHARTIRMIASRLAAIPDLQTRVDHSKEARLLAAIRSSDSQALAGLDSARTEPVPMVWPSALAECLAEDERFRTAPPEADDRVRELGDEKWQLQQQEADIVHRMLGLITYAANPRNIDLTDHPELAATIVQLCAESQAQSKIRR